MNITPKKRRVILHGNIHQNGMSSYHDQKFRFRVEQYLPLILNITCSAMKRKIHISRHLFDQAGFRSHHHDAIQSSTVPHIDLGKVAC